MILRATLLFSLSLPACGAPDAPSSPESAAPSTSRAAPAAPSEPQRRTAASAEPESAEVPAEPTAHPAPPTDTPEVNAGTLRLVVQHAAPLLGSESRALDAWKRRLGATDTVEDPDEVERAAIDGLVSHTPGTLPAAWSTYETVVVLRIATPTASRGGRQLSGGIVGVLVLRPPSNAPIVDVAVEDRAAWSVAEEAFGEWLAGAVRGAAS